MIQRMIQPTGNILHSSSSDPTVTGMPRESHRLRVFSYLSALAGSSVWGTPGSGGQGGVIWTSAYSLWPGSTLPTSSVEFHNHYGHFAFTDRATAGGNRTFSVSRSSNRVRIAFPSLERPRREIVVARLRCKAQVAAAELRGGWCLALNSLKLVISGGAPSRKGNTSVPIPRLT